MGLDAVDQNRKRIVADPNYSGTERCAFFCANFCSYFSAILFFPPIILCCFGCQCCYLNYPMKSYVYSSYGKVRFVENKETHPGIRFRCCNTNLEKTSVDLKLGSMTARGSSVPDATGSPLNVSAMISFVVDDPIAFLYSVENPASFVQNQMFEVMRRVCSKFKYKSTDESEVTLLEDSHLIAIEMCKLLKKRTAIAGVKILRMDFVDLSYSSEMAV